MARSVNVTQTNWRRTGATVPVDQWEMTETIEWIDDAGVSHTDTRTVRYPNSLAAVPLATLGEWAKELVYRAHRRILGIGGDE